jgi:hypothetical protein
MVTNRNKNPNSWARSSDFHTRSMLDNFQADKKRYEAQQLENVARIRLWDMISGSSELKFLIKVAYDSAISSKKMSEELVENYLKSNPPQEENNEEIIELNGKRYKLIE